MATRADYRAMLVNKLQGLEDSGYGDFDPSPAEMNTFLALAISGLYPAVYRRLSQSGLTVTAYGTDSTRGRVTVSFPEKVYLVEDAEELTIQTGWQLRPTSIVGLDTAVTTVNVYYHDAFTLPADDVTDVGLSAAYSPLVILGAEIEVLEARHDNGVRPDVSKGYEQVSLIDRLSRRYARLVEDKAMALPAVNV